MSVGNVNTSGSKRSNFPFQIAVLKLLDGILSAVGGGIGVDTPTMNRVSGPGSVTAGAKSVSFRNAGGVNATVLTKNLLPGEVVTFSTGTNATLPAIAYDGTGTDLLIITVT